MRVYGEKIVRQELIEELRERIRNLVDLKRTKAAQGKKEEVQFLEGCAYSLTEIMVFLQHLPE